MSLMQRILKMLGAAPNGASSQGQVSCHDALRLVHEFLDGELKDVTAAEVKAHLEACEHCYPHLRLEESFREALRRVTLGESAPPELRARVKELLAGADA